MRFFVLSVLLVACGQVRVEKGEQGLAGADGPTGAKGSTGATGATGSTGATGPAAGDSSLVKSSMTCIGDITTTTLRAVYHVVDFRGGDVFVTGSLYGPAVEYGTSDFFAAGTNGAVTGHVQFVYDILDTPNIGFWTMESNRTTKTLVVEYDDPDLTSQQHVWTISGADCTLKTY